MALRFTSILLLAFSATAALGGNSPNAQTTELLNVARVMDNTIALYDTINDRSMKCLYCTRPVYVPEQRFAVYVYHYPNKKNASWNEKNAPYCLNLTESDLGYFSFGPCEEPEKQGRAQTLYFDGKSCYVGRLPLSGTYHCLLFLKKGYEDSVPEECVKQYDEKCGPKKYTLYNKDYCS